MTGWHKSEDDVDWASMSCPTRRISDEWIEKAVFGFRKVKSVPLAVAEQGLVARGYSTDVAQNHCLVRNGLSRAEMDELEQWLGPQAWKLDLALDVLAVELFAGRGQLESLLLIIMK
jgi:hypothetical protein